MSLTQIYFVGIYFVALAVVVLANMGFGFLVAGGGTILHVFARILNDD